MKLTAYCSLSTALLLLLNGRALLAASSFIPLGDLPGGQALSYAIGVNESGTVVVGGSTTSNDPNADATSAFLWNDTEGLTSIVDPIFSVGKVSGDGSTVVGSYREIPGADIKAFLWTANGGLAPLNIPSSANPNGVSYAKDVSEDGSVVVGSAGPHAFRWTTNGGFSSLVADIPSNALTSEAEAVSNDGASIAGYYTASDSTLRAFHWTNATGAIDLGDLPGGRSEARASDISADGDWVVGTSSSSASDSAGFIWSQATGMRDLEAPSSTLTFPFAVTNAGNAVVGRSDVLGVSGDAFLWTEARQFELLQDVLTNHFDLGNQLAGWTLTAANDISADGRYLVGQGINPDGNTEAWLVRLDQPVFAPPHFVPEPSAISLFLAFFLPHVMAQRKRSHQA